MTHLENKGFAFHSLSEFSEEILCCFYRCNKGEFSSLICCSWWKIEVISREKGPVSQKKELVLQQKFIL